MKKAAVFLFSVLVYGTVYSQSQDYNSKMMIGIFTNTGINQPVRFHRISSEFEPRAYHGSGSYSAGIKFSKFLSYKYKLELGAVYSVYKVGFEDPEFIPYNGIVFHETFETFSIPIILKTYFNNNYFLGTGTMIDIGLPRNSLFTDTQTGFGFSIGGGKDFIFKNFILDLTPNIEIHSVLPFSYVSGQQRLVVFGIRLGLINNCL
jgi:hypothetical protein